MKNFLLLFFSLALPASITAMDNTMQEKENRLITAWAQLQIAERRMRQAGSFDDGYSNPMRSMYSSDCAMHRECIENLKKELPAERLTKILRACKKKSRQLMAEEELRKAWGFLKMVQAKSKHTPSLFMNQQCAKANDDIESAKRVLPANRADEIIKKLEDEWNRPKL